MMRDFIKFHPNKKNQIENYLNENFKKVPNSAVYLAIYNHSGWSKSIKPALIRREVKLTLKQTKKILILEIQMNSRQMKITIILTMIAFFTLMFTINQNLEIIWVCLFVTLLGVLKIRYDNARELEKFKLKIKNAL